ncbi:MAG: hypothetical protein DIU83_01215 [Bacillota bacterium]|nr:MAG: hypothetical protein DIU83_01215 [Bacillota bacterium]
MNSGFLTDKVRPAKTATRMDNETYRIRVEDLFKELHDESGAVNEAVKEQLKELALLPRKTRHFLRVLNDQPLEVQAEFYRHIFREVKGDDFYKDLERHVRHRFYEARDEFKELLGMLDDPDAIQALMHVIALTEEGWLAGELIRIVLAHDPEQAREPVRHALESGDYLLQCLGIYLAGKSKSDPLLEELSRFYRRPFGDKVDRLERKSYDALLEGSEGVSDDLILRWLRDSSARVREVGIIAAARRRLKASVEDLVRLVLVDNRTRPRAAQALLDFEAEGLLEFSPEDEAGRAMAGILNAAKREPLLNMLKELTRDENATVRELTVKLVRLLDEPAPLAGAVRSAVDDRVRGVQVGALETLARIAKERFFDAAAETLSDPAAHEEVVQRLQELIAETMSAEERQELEAETERRRKRREEVLDKFARPIESWRHDLE